MAPSIPAALTPTTPVATSSGVRQVNKKGKEPKKRTTYKRYGKLMLIISCATHGILAAVASAGPTPDIDQLDGVVAELPPSIAVRHMVGDAGFDSAHNHSLLRDYHGMRSTIPPEHGRPPKDPKDAADGQIPKTDEDAF